MEEELPLAPGDDKISLFDQPDDVDWFLAHQVHMADAYTIEQGITLNVGGVLVSGTLISGRTYFKELSEMLRKKTRGTSSAAYGEMLGNTFDMFKDVYPAPVEGQSYAQRMLNYIHLRDAFVFGSNGSISPASGTLWRGKLAAVEGFSFGNLTPA